MDRRRERLIDVTVNAVDPIDHQRDNHQDPNDPFVRHPFSVAIYLKIDPAKPHGSMLAGGLGPALKSVA